ncbi:LamG-like jellyroll fold domain-containing protein [Siphonobacter sp.]|uniref:LamG-like jellyroll fold domain-containing protein n=1 Tax=Siphonobacter sp. TaxID=1869184 RepID=UPI003B3B8098
MKKPLLGNAISILKLCLFSLILLVSSCGKDKFPQRIFPKCEPIAAQIATVNNQLKVDYSLNVNAADFDRVEWDFGDQKTASSFTNSHTYDKAGTYTVKVKLTNKCGDQATVSKSVTVVQDVVPSVATGGSSRVNNTTANVAFKLLNLGLPTATQYGICYSYINSSPQVGGAQTQTQSVSALSNGDSTVIALSNLTPGVSYYYCSYIKDSNGTYHYGEIKKFETTNADIWTGLVAYYDFNTDTGTQIKDLSGKNNTGTLKIGADIITTGRNNNTEKVLRLDGVSGYLDINDHASLRPSKLTVSLWFRIPDGLPADVLRGMQLYYKSDYNTGDNALYSAWVKYGGSTPNVTIHADIKPKESDDCSKESKWAGPHNTQHRDEKSWHHFVAVFDGSVGKTYLDGELWAIETGIGGSGIRDCSGGSLRFGIQHQKNQDNFKGHLDDIRVYEVPLTEAQIRELSKH